MTSAVEQIQASIADAVARLEIMRGVRVVVDRSATLEGKLEEKLTGKTGLSVLVKMPAPSAAAMVGAAVTFSTIVCRVRVIENIPTNQSGMSAATAAQVILKALAGTTPSGAASALTPRATYPWNQITGTATTNAVELVLETSATL